MWTRFWKGGQKHDLDEAISLYRQALELQPPPHPNRSSSLSNLASVLRIRFEHEGHRIDLDEAISLNREVLNFYLPPHHDRGGSLYNLATALAIQFEAGGRKSDLDEAISLIRQAVDLQPSPHPGQPLSLHMLGTLLIHAHSLAGEDSQYLEESMSSFIAASQCVSQPPSGRLRSTKAWITHADRYQHISAIDAYTAALQALPEMAALSSDVYSRQEALTARSDGLARDASRCAIRSGKLDKAIEFLEQGRSIFWSQILFLRSPFDELHDIAPELADKLKQIATMLGLESYREVSVDIADKRKKLSIHREVSQLNRLNEEWAKSIDEVRKLNGFEDFLRPSRLSSLISSASKYPVVILVANNDYSHCLIMTLRNVHHFPLPKLHTPMLTELVRLVHVAVSQLPISRSVMEETKERLLELLGEERKGRPAKFVDNKLGSSDDVFRFILGFLWDELVKPVIDVLNIKVGQ